MASFGRTGCSEAICCLARSGHGNSGQTCPLRLVAAGESELTRRLFTGCWEDGSAAVAGGIRRWASAATAGQTMFSGLCTAVRALTDPSGAQRQLRGPKRATILAAGGCFLRQSGQNGGGKTEIPANTGASGHRADVHSGGPPGLAAHNSRPRRRT